MAKAPKNIFYKIVAKTHADKKDCMYAAELLADENYEVKPASVYQRILSENRQLKDAWIASKKAVKESDNPAELPLYVQKLAEREKPPQLPILKQNMNKTKGSSDDELYDNFSLFFGQPESVEQQMGGTKMNPLAGIDIED